jgi:hypothetical protein
MNKEKTPFSAHKHAERLSTVINSIADAVLEYSVNHVEPPDLTIKTFESSIIIFQFALMDHLWKLQVVENMPQEQREEMATAAGTKLRELVKTFTGIDTHSMYPEN